MEALRIEPASAAAWEDVRAVFGTRGEAARCLCQRMRLPHRAWHAMTLSEREARLRAQTGAGEPGAAATSGLVAWLGDDPVGWCAVEPRPVFAKLFQSQATVPWAGRSEDRADAGVWAVACFVTRAGFRRRGVMRALTAATVGHARARGARAVEGYPMAASVGGDVPWGEMSVGAESAFAAAGFRVVSRPVPRRVVMRVDLGNLGGRRAPGAPHPAGSDNGGA